MEQAYFKLCVCLHLHMHICTYTHTHTHMQVPKIAKIFLGNVVRELGVYDRYNNTYCIIGIMARLL